MTVSITQRNSNRVWMVGNDFGGEFSKPVNLVAGWELQKRLFELNGIKSAKSNTLSSSVKTDSFKSSQSNLKKVA